MTSTETAPRIISDPASGRTCTAHGATVQFSNRAGSHCWVCDNAQPACPHPGATFKLVGYAFNREHSWKSFPCPACQAEQNAAAAAERVARELAAAEQAAAERATRIAREEEIARQLRRGEVAMAARYAGRCAECDSRIQVGQQIAYNRTSRTARHLMGCRPERNTFVCRYCGEAVIGGQSSFGGYLCPMSEEGEQPHRA